MGDTYEQRGNTLASELFYNQALDSAKAVQAARPEDLEADGHVAQCYRMLGQYLTRQKHLDEALAANQAANAILQRMARRASSDQQVQTQLAISFDLIADDQKDMGRRGDAPTFYRQAQDILRRLVRANPTDAALRRTLSVTLGRLAIVAAARGP